MDTLPAHFVPRISNVNQKNVQKNLPLAGNDVWGSTVTSMTIVRRNGVIRDCVYPNKVAVCRVMKTVTVRETTPCVCSTTARIRLGKWTTSVSAVPVETVTLAVARGIATQCVKPDLATERRVMKTATANPTIVAGPIRVKQQVEITKLSIFSFGSRLVWRQAGWYIVFILAAARREVNTRRFRPSERYKLI